MELMKSWNLFPSSACPLVLVKSHHSLQMQVCRALRVITPSLGVNKTQESILNWEFVQNAVAFQRFHTGLVLISDSGMS